jgi:PhnB protein
LKLTLSLTWAGNKAEPKLFSGKGSKNLRPDSTNIIQMNNESGSAFFAPQLIIPNGVRDLGFYTNGLGATEINRWSNEDGSIHVAEISLEGAIFHLHQEAPEKGLMAPENNQGVTAVIGLFVPNPDALMAKALKAGAREISPVQDYDYGYRQGQFKDPFGHHWLIQKKI